MNFREGLIMARLDALNAVQRRTASRSLFIRRARLPRWAVLRIVWRAAK